MLGSIVITAVVRALKLDRKTVSEHRRVVSIKSEGVALKDMTLVGGIRFLIKKGLKAKSLMPDVFTKNVLHKSTCFTIGVDLVGLFTEITTLLQFSSSIDIFHGA
jgi:hypothetical protein